MGHARGLNRGGWLSSILPQAYNLIPMGVECFMKLVSPNLSTRDAMVNTTTVEVHPVHGRRALIPFHQVAVTDWARLLVAEVSTQGGTKETARLALNNTKLSKGEPWLPASTKLVLHMRVAQADHLRPHASEEIHFWRFITAAALIILLGGMSVGCVSSPHAGQTFAIISLGSGAKGGHGPTSSNARGCQPPRVGVHGTEGRHLTDCCIQKIRI